MTTKEDKEQPPCKRYSRDEVREYVKSGNAKRRKLQEMCTSLGQYRLMCGYLRRIQKPRNFKTFVIWIYGPSGSGKSDLAHTMCGEDIYEVLVNDFSFCGYDHEEFCLWDNFRFKKSKMIELLHLMDRYPYTTAEGAKFLSRYLVFVSIRNPEERWTAICQEPVERLSRRIDCLIQFTDFKQWEVLKGNLPSKVAQHIEGNSKWT